jgi:hypothetical protein
VTSAENLVAGTICSNEGTPGHTIAYMPAFSRRNPRGQDDVIPDPLRDESDFVFAVVNRNSVYTPREDVTHARVGSYYGHIIAKVGPRH